MHPNRNRALRVPKRLQKIHAVAVQHGWYLHRRCGNGHYLYRHPHGGTYVIPSTPSEHRGLRNAEAHFKRAGGRR
jgi:predicted RNA binding protein YcfA (HicA-like mRNA interferase family)